MASRLGLALAYTLDSVAERFPRASPIFFSYTGWGTNVDLPFSNTSFREVFFRVFCDRGLIPFPSGALAPLDEIAAGADGIFIETHPDLSKAQCDASSMLPLNEFSKLIGILKRIHEVVKERKHKE